MEDGESKMDGDQSKDYKMIYFVQKMEDGKSRMGETLQKPTK
jgi:hypothetical protein